jgi:hypothetical protein
LAREIAETFLREADRGARTTECGVGRRLLGHTCLWQGDFIEAQANLLEALPIYDPERDREAMFRFGVDTGAAARAYLASTKWLLGEVGPARALIEEADALAIETGHVPTLVNTYMFKAHYNRTMEWYNRPLKLETIARYVADRRLSEREAALLRGSPAMRGFRGPLWPSLARLENFSPGATKRWVGTSKLGWKRNVGPAHTALLVAKIQGRLRKRRGVPRPSSKDRCKARSKQAGRQCRNWAHPKPGSGRYPTCHMHGAMAAPFGQRACGTTIAPFSVAASMLRRWPACSGASRTTSTRRRRSFRVTSAARLSKVSVVP